MDMSKGPIDMTWASLAEKKETQNIFRETKLSATEKTGHLTGADCTVTGPEGRNETIIIIHCEFR